MAAGLDKSNGNLSVVVIFTSACFYNYTLEKILNFMILCMLLEYIFKGFIYRGGVCGTKPSSLILFIGVSVALSLLKLL